MKLEHKSQPLLPKKEYYKRILYFSMISFCILVFSILAGTIGYHHFGSLAWVDSFYNASMILTGMGPVNPMDSQAGKIFASFYAIYSGVAFLVLAGVLFAPVFHRFLHSIHLDIED